MGRFPGGVHCPEEARYRVDDLTELVFAFPKGFLRLHSVININREAVPLDDPPLSVVQRLPAMIAPAWLKNATQPIAIDDTLRYLVQAPAIAASAGREVQIGGPDVLSYGEMLDRMAAVLELRRRPRVPVPLITPWLSSLWIGMVTPVDAGVARPLVEGLALPTVVTDPSGAALFDVQPMSFDEALRRAVADDPELRPRRQDRRLPATRP